MIQKSALTKPKAHQIYTTQLEVIELKTENHLEPIKITFILVS